MSRPRWGVVVTTFCMFHSNIINSLSVAQVHHMYVDWLVIMAPTQQQPTSPPTNPST